jgi:hypothetical protein
MRLKISEPPFPASSSSTNVARTATSSSSSAQLMCIFYKNLHGNGKLERDLDPYLCPLLQYTFVLAPGNVDDPANSSAMQPASNPHQFPSAIDGAFLSFESCNNETYHAPIALLEFSSPHKCCVLSFYDAYSLLPTPTASAGEAMGAEEEKPASKLQDTAGGKRNATALCRWTFPPSVLLRRIFPIRRQQQQPESVLESSAVALFVALKPTQGAPGAEFLYHFQETVAGHLDAAFTENVLKHASYLELEIGERVVDVLQQFFKSSVGSEIESSSTLCLFSVLTSRRVLIVNDMMEILTDSSASASIQDDIPHPLSMLWVGCVLLYTAYGESNVRYESYRRPILLYSFVSRNPYIYI